MNINGSLKFDASGLSQIVNLRLEKLSALPTFQSSDVGRLVYITGSQVIWLGGATAWISLATGGNAAALQAEVDAVEASLGGLVKADGTYDATGLTGNLSGSTSVTNVFTKLQALVATAQAASDNEVTRATAAEGTLTSNLAAEVARAEGAESANTTAIGAEMTRAQGVESTLTSGLSSEVTRATGAESTLSTAISAETTRATAAETANHNAIVSEAGTARAAEGTNAMAITAEVTRATAAETVLTTAVNAEVSRATAADTAQIAATNAEVTRATAAEATLTTNLAAEISRATNRENAIVADYNAKIQGLAWKNPVRVAAIGNISLTSAANGYDGVTLTAGDRILVASQTDATQNGIYVFNGTGQALTRAIDMDAASEFDNATVYVRDGQTMSGLGFTVTGDVNTLGTDPVNFTQFNGAGSVSAGAGLTQSGNVINVVNSDGSITVTADEIHVSTALQNVISANTAAITAEAATARAAESTNATAIANEATARGAAIAAEHTTGIAYTDAETTRAVAAELVLRNNLASEVTRATAAEGVNAAAVTAETTRATAAEGANTSAITAETSRATTAEGTLTTNLAAEVSRATAAEGTLTTAVAANTAKLAKLYFLYTSTGPSASHTVTHNLGQQYCNVTVVDSTDNVVIPESIVFNSANGLTVTFNSAIDCKVVVMGVAS